MKCILIDPAARAVSEVARPGKDFREIYGLIDADTFTVVAVSETEALYLDDNGLLTDEPVYMFKWRGYDSPLAGKGLIVGVDAEGEDVDTKMTVDEVSAQIEWLGRQNVDGIDTFEGEFDHPVLGRVRGVKSTVRISPAPLPEEAE